MGNWAGADGNRVEESGFPNCADGPGPIVRGPAIAKARREFIESSAQNSQWSEDNGKHSWAERNARDGHVARTDTDGTGSPYAVLELPGQRSVGPVAQLFQ